MKAEDQMFHVEHLGIDLRALNGWLRSLDSDRMISVIFMSMICWTELMVFSTFCLRSGCLNGPSFGSASDFRNKLLAQMAQH